MCAADGGEYVYNNAHTLQKRRLKGQRATECIFAKNSTEPWVVSPTQREKSDTSLRRHQNEQITLPR